jgi:hypothetical protein
MNHKGQQSVEKQQDKDLSVYILARPLKLVVCLLSVNGVFVELNTTSI